MTVFKGKTVKELHELIGMIIHAQAKIEHGISVMIANLIEVDNEIGLILSVEMPYKLRSQALLNVVAFQSRKYPKLKDLNERYQVLVKRMNEAEGKRNMYAHSSMLSLEDNDAYVRMKYQAKGKGLKLVQDEFSLDDLKKLTEEQESILAEIKELFELGNMAVKQLPRKVREAIAQAKEDK